MSLPGPDPLLELTQKLPSPSEAPYCLSECRWGEIKNNSLCVDGLAHQAPVVLSVLFNNESGNLFSTVHIILCCSKELHDKKWRDWAIRDMGSALYTGETVHSFDRTGSTRINPGNSTPLNDPSMPKCTVVFEMTDHQECAHGPVWIGPALRASCDPRLAQQSSICTLLDREIPLPPDTRAVTLSFITHSVTCTRMDLPLQLQPIAQHSVEVHPIITLRQIPYKELPVEILMTIFRYIAETPKYRRWRHDLLSCALVCRQWICSLDFLLWDLHNPHNTRQLVTKPLDIQVIAKVVTERPVLAGSVNHLSTQYLQPLLPFPRKSDSVSLPAFTSSLITILESTRNLRTLELTHLDVSQTEALGNTICDLPLLHTFSTGLANPATPARDGVISIVQLAYCLASWPSLKSLTIHGLQPPTLMDPTAPLRPPACTLTELHIEKVFMTDTELMYLTASSFKTLESVTMDHIHISDAGLRTFLECISQNVSTLVLRGVGRTRGTEERALDATIVKMRRLKNLVINGGVATELMLDRRASLFRTSRSTHGLTDGPSFPIVRLSFDPSPVFPATIADREWPGWDIIKPYTGWRCGGVLRGYRTQELEALNRRPEGYLRTVLGHGSVPQSSTT